MRFSLLLALFTSVSAQVLPVRWNLGSSLPSIVDRDGKTWMQDEFFTGTPVGTCPGPFFWTDLANLVCSRTEWNGPSSGDLEIPVPEPGLYEATLYFSEVDGTAGDRVMDVFVEERATYTDVDVVAATGYSTSYFTLTLVNYVADGTYTLRLDAKKGKPALAAFSLKRYGATPAPTMAPPPSPPAPVLPTQSAINLGATTTNTGNDGTIWAPDIITTGSAVDQCSTFTFQGLPNPFLYCQYREWTSPASLEFPIARGTYRVTLHFSETSAAAGERLVDVYFEGSKVLTGLDVSERLGGSYGYFRYSITGYIGDGAASIELRATKGTAVLAAVQIVDVNAPPAPVPVPTIAPTTAPTLPITNPPTVAPVPNIQRYTMGSSTKTVDTDGLVWDADIFTTGTAVNVCNNFPFTGFATASVLCSFREWVGTSGILQLPTVTPGTYTLQLFFSETSAAAGERVVDVFVNGLQALANLDVAQEVGGSYGFYTYSVTGPVFDGIITLELRASQGNPVLAGFQLTRNGDLNPVPAQPVALPTSAPVVAPAATPTNAPVVTSTGAPVATPTSAPIVTPTGAPVVAPTDAPITVPTDAPVVSPTSAPVVVVTAAPVVAATSAPVVAVTAAPVESPTSTPVVVVTAAPVVAATSAPVVAVTAAPVVATTSAPVVTPTSAPVSVVSVTGAPVVTPSNFSVRINCGSTTPYVDAVGNTWLADNNTQGGTYSACPKEIAGTVDDTLYCSERWGVLDYSIDVPVGGTYQVNLHFAEVFYGVVGLRVFEVVVNDVNQGEVDIVKLAPGADVAYILSTTTTDNNGVIVVQLKNLVENPKISAIEIVQV